MRKGFVRGIALALSSMMLSGAFLALTPITAEAKTAETYVSGWAKNRKFTGASVNDPTIPSGAAKDEDATHYTFMVVDTYDRSYTSTKKGQVVFATDREGNGKLYVTEVPVSGSAKQVGTLEPNSSKDGIIPLFSSYGSGEYYSSSGLKTYGALGIFSNGYGYSYNVRSLFGSALLDAQYGSAYAPQAPNVFLPAYIVGGDSRTQKEGAIMRVIPKMRKQNTYYIGREAGKPDTLLASYTQYGLDGQTYTAPDQKDFYTWKFVEQKGKKQGVMGLSFDSKETYYHQINDEFLSVFNVKDPARGTSKVDVYQKSAYGSMTYNGARYTRVGGGNLYSGQKSIEVRINYSGGYSVITESNPYTSDIEDVYYYYEKIQPEPKEPEPPKEYDYPTPGRTIELTKPLEVENIAHAYIPSVPDATFHYEVAYEDNTGADKENLKLNDAKTGYVKDELEDRYKPVATGVDVNGTIFEVWRGPVGGVTVSDVTFTHDDKVDENATVTREIEVKINGGEGTTDKVLFKRPGVYRYPIKEVCVKEEDFGENNAEAANVTGNDKDGHVVNGWGSDIKVKENELRYLDVYVEWNSNENGFVIKDCVLHDIAGNLDYDSLNAQDKEYSKPGSEAAVSNDQTAPSKKTGFSKSLYTTYDLVIGKEVMGKGLTKYDVEMRLFKFEVKIEGPAGTKIGRNMPAGANTRTQEKDMTIPDNGLLETTVELHHGEYALFSGLPSGVQYEVIEVNNHDRDNGYNEPDAMDVFEVYNANDLEEMIVTADSAAGLLLDQPGRNVKLMTLQGDFTKKLADETISEEEKKEIRAGALGIVRFEQNETKTSQEQTIGVRTAEDSANNVFFLNLRYDNVTTGVAMSVAPYALMVLAAVIGVGGFLVVKRRRDAEYED